MITKDGCGPKNKPAHGGRGGDSQRHRHQRPRAHFRHHDFQNEQRAADRRVEGRRNASGRATGDQDNSLPDRNAQPLSDHRAKGRTDLNDRSFAARRTAAADGERRRQRFHRRHRRPNPAAAKINCIHDFRDSVSFCLRRKIFDQERHAERAHDRNQNDQRPPRAGRRVQVGVIRDGTFTQKEQIVEQRDQSAKHHRSQAGHAADQHRQQRKPQRSQRPVRHGVHFVRFHTRLSFACSHEFPACSRANSKLMPGLISSGIHIRTLRVYKYGQ